MKRNRKLVILGIGLVSGFVLPAAVRAVVNADSYECKTDAIKVEPGDDYWGYLQEFCTGNLESASIDVVNFYGPILMPGRLIYLPSSDECELSLTTMEDGNEYVYETCPE